MVLGLQVVERDPGGLLSVGVGHLGRGLGATIVTLLRGRLGELIYTATDEDGRRLGRPSAPPNAQDL